MKSASTRTATRRHGLRDSAGKVISSSRRRSSRARSNHAKPTPGWKAYQGVGFANPRTPSVPITLDLSLEGYYAATTLMGLLAGQASEPDMNWACDWAFDMGTKMAAEERRRRRARAR